MPLHNAIWYLVPHAGYEKRPEIFKFGVMATYTACQQLCDIEPGCYAFAYAQITAAGDWSNTCFGRGFGQPERLVYDINFFMSGVKLC